MAEAQKTPGGLWRARGDDFLPQGAAVLTATFQQPGKKRVHRATVHYGCHPKYVLDAAAELHRRYLKHTTFLLWVRVPGVSGMWGHERGEFDSAVSRAAAALP